MGLGSILYIQCEECPQLNAIKTGKTHSSPTKKNVGRPIWDINTKAATGSINAGIGATGMNVFLTSLNIPWLSKRAYRFREEEAIEGILHVTKETCTEAISREVEAVVESNPTETTRNKAEINASFDAGWQKRGSGRAYNSLSGHSTLIGSRTGGVLSYAVRSKSCRVCDHAKRTNQTGRKHQCSQNWTGSAKSMEPSMGVELTRGLTGELDLHNKGKGQSIKYSVGNIIMDGDTTTISHIHQNVSDQISVWSDIGHAKKALHGHLLRISSSHKALSKTVIDYLVKCFGYVLTQNKGNPEGIRKGCKVIPNHAFGDHSSCGSWCQHKKNAESYRHQSLPHGKDLEGEDLKADLLQVFELFASYADKLAPMGSTQLNESFNNLVSVHAPKRLHFSGSASQRGRVAFAVATKNSGKSTICKVRKMLRFASYQQCSEQGNNRPLIDMFCPRMEFHSRPLKQTN
ncbi:uncharacterized protein LOC141866350 [Acropora palmata]|uniref:uncharacterized protein LOC141866350 n=1 Tax=Acropora palmata TaxID=6131 RepID=UPI003D9FF184